MLWLVVLANEAAHIDMDAPSRRVFVFEMVKQAFD